MRNLIGCLKKTLLATSLFFLLFPLSNLKVSAQENPFHVSSSFIHNINGTNVSTELTIYLATEATRVLSLYTTSIQAKNIKANCFTSNGNSIKCESYNRTSTTDVQMDLKNTVISPGSPLTIKITYSFELENEISYSLPSKVLDAKTDEIKIIYPNEKGDFAWPSENISSKEQRNGKREVVFKNPAKDIVAIFFDSKLQYSFRINRQLTNSSPKEYQTFELVVPLDDTSQVVIWEDISPLPNSSIQDEDGNYIFRYILKPGESTSVQITGIILKEASNQVQSNEQAFLTHTGGYWEVDDTSEIKRIASFMKDKGLDINPLLTSVESLNTSQRELFHKFLYQYIIYRLDFPDNVQLGIENALRVGANNIQKNALESTQIDYADFYIALLRHYSIPSRMVLGYISNVTGGTSDGFYHYWVEYFDKDKEKWVQVDPFLDEYFGYSIYGVNLNDHIAILKRGKSPLAPTLTFYSPTDFILNIDSSGSVKKDMSVNSSLNFDTYDITKQYAKAYITTSNTGNIIISEIDFPHSNIGNVKTHLDSVNNNSSLILLPKQTNTIQINIPTKDMFFNTVSISSRFKNNSGLNVDLTISDEIPQNIPLYVRVLSKILSLASFAMLLLLIYTIYKLSKRKQWTQQ